MSDHQHPNTGAVPAPSAPAIANRGADCAALHARVQELEGRLRWMERTLSWRWTEPVRRLMGRLETLARHPRRRAPTPTSAAAPPVEGGIPNPPPAPAAGPVHPRPVVTPAEGHYGIWSRWNDPRPAELAQQPQIADWLPERPLISVLMPVYDPPERFLREAIESVLEQTYPNWELCIVDDASTAPHVQPMLERFAAREPRIKLRFRSENGHISRSSNDALALAAGDFVALLDHDDRLSPDALYEVAACICRHPQADLIYTDEDKIDAGNNRGAPYFKPEWSPDSLLSRMYIGHLSIYRRSLMQRIGGFREGFEGSQDYDLALRFTEHTESILHIPKVLYHWRIHADSIASGIASKPYASQAARRAISEALERRGEPGKVVPSRYAPERYIVRYRITAEPKVEILIPTRDQPALLERCLETLFSRTRWRRFNVTLIDNGSVDADALALMRSWTRREAGRCRVLRMDMPFNFALLNNRAVEQTDGEMLLFLNNDTEVISKDWLEAMIEQAGRPSIGAVGPMLLYPDERVQHAGVILGPGSVAAHGHLNAAADEAGYFGQVQSISNVAAVTGACLMCRREVFDAIGGFDEGFPVAFNDVDLCLRLLDQGLRNLYIPHVRLYHHESKSRGRDLADAKKRDQLIRDVQAMRERWGPLLDDDPYYSPHLTRHALDFSIRVPRG